MCIRDRIMVINFTFGKPKYAKYEKELKKISSRLEKLKEQLLELVDLDVVAFNSKDLRFALEVPLRLCRLSFLAIALCPKLIGKTNINLISDILVASVLLESGFSGGYFNVLINLQSLRDKVLLKRITQELNKKKKLVNKIRKETEVKVDKIIRR
ncbi:MAG: cyclodeaminase/cyclohydrolase family protein, partial [Candidatus Omnitrophica bacterium]|nr:cyclodeaminase/cyclohydrolase family protein [Candidatus Omnitrophota bacterium]